MKKVVSVIIPVYNVENYLHRCIKSIINQSYKNLEIIIINDGSTDSSGEICEYYKKKDNRIKVFYQNNQGVSVARNQGLQFITGDYFMFLDSDDAYELDLIEKALIEIERTKVDLVVFGWKKIYETGEIEEWNPKTETLSDTDFAIKRLLYNFSDFGGGYPNKLWRRKCFGEKVPYYENSLFYYEDSEWMTRMFMNVKSITTLDYSGYLYYIRNNSVTQIKGMEEQRELGYHKSMLKILEDLNEREGLQKWFFAKYTPELINGYFHAIKTKWNKLRKFLGNQIFFRKKELLSVKMDCKIRVRFFVVIVLRVLNVY